MAPNDPHYRPHLDGIRALAVVLVILFHLGLDWLPGGFIGVDVFFVLSGYLITGILLREASASGRIRLSRFYARRARRLLPASIAVLATVLFVGSRTLDPVQKDSLGHDGLWSALYSANWRFGTVGGDYFAPGDVPSALVHYWSLAVEEQI
jgi:peptidoglycan/LPS O-acetylase OafA/YrhL